MLVDRVVGAAEAVERLGAGLRRTQSLIIATPSAGWGVADTRMRPVRPVHRHRQRAARRIVGRHGQDHAVPDAVHAGDAAGGVLGALTDSALEVPRPYAAGVLVERLGADEVGQRRVELMTRRCIGPGRDGSAVGGIGVGPGRVFATSDSRSPWLAEISKRNGFVWTTAVAPWPTTTSWRGNDATAAPAAAGWWRAPTGSQAPPPSRARTRAESF